MIQLVGRSFTGSIKDAVRDGPSAHGKDILV